MALDWSNISVFKAVDLHFETNNNEHCTREISVKKLIVRRGQSFILTLKLAQPFSPDVDQLTMTASTGDQPSEDRGTMSCFGVPDKVKRSASAKAVWKAELQKTSSTQTGVLILTLTPPADAPIGDYKLSAKLQGKESLLANLFVLFNPWCPADWVFLPDEAERQEYVMNERGIIYKGAHNYISSMDWDFGQFEEDMVEICLKVLDLNVKHLCDPADDVSARCNPIYVSRVVSSMINSGNECGVLHGNWFKDFGGGVPPSHWSGSYAILKKWHKSSYSPVKFGQCWVFASVMCSVMRLLGIPCRVVTNYQSAHDTNKNLIVEVYYAENGVREKESRDSIWNFHVWVEGWMKRPDLSKNGKYDGWQVLDPTPQEKSEGMFCCGPAPVSAIRNGDTHLKYDVPFVFAEVNADYVCFLVNRDGTKEKKFTDTKIVGQNISTKSVASGNKMDLTDAYKFREGTQEERRVFKYALDRLENPATGNLNDENGMENPNAPTSPSGPPQLLLRFQDVSKPVNGEDVKLKLILCSDSSVPRLLSVNISVQALKYTGQPAGNIQTEVTEQKLLPGQDLSIPILVPFQTYHKYMIECKSMNIAALITDQQNKNQTYLAEQRIVLKAPPLSLTVPRTGEVDQEFTAEVVFMNPFNKTLRNCTLTFTGSGLLFGEKVITLADLNPSSRFKLQLSIVPYRSGERTLLVDLDCDTIRNVKASCTIDIKP